MRDRWLRSPSVRDFELGRITRRTFAARFVDEWQVPVTPDAFLEDLAAWIEQPYPGAEELLARLRERHHVSCLTNCNELHWAKLAAFVQCFDSAFSSHLLGADQARRGGLPGGAWTRWASSRRTVRFFDDSRAQRGGGGAAGHPGLPGRTGPTTCARASRSAEGLL